MEINFFSRSETFQENPLSNLNKEFETIDFIFLEMRQIFGKESIFLFSDSPLLISRIAFIIWITPAFSLC